MAASSTPPRKSAAPKAQFYRAKGYSPEESVGYMMRKILSAIARGVERELSHADLTNAQWVPLFKLHVGQATTAAELARECHLDAGAMTRMLDRLEAKGLCRRERSATDRRVVHIQLTAAGQRAAEEVPHALSAVHNAHLAGFTAEEFDTLKSMLRRMLANAETATQLATPANNTSHDHP